MSPVYAESQQGRLLPEEEAHGILGYEPASQMNKMHLHGQAAMFGQG